MFPPLSLFRRMVRCSVLSLQVEVLWPTPHTVDVPHTHTNLPFGLEANLDISLSLPFPRWIRGASIMCEVSVCQSSDRRHHPAVSAIVPWCHEERMCWARLAMIYGGGEMAMQPTTRLVACEDGPQAVIAPSQCVYTEFVDRETTQSASILTAHFSPSQHSHDRSLCDMIKGISAR
ncbi:hypothetical protein F5Y17DRAFT_410155 [Xylariaceae sp. FL0594]|nr:hypothetical protein F5Y17DRAFT_410155 [Xylariaceae sp. FL0594]